MDALMQQAMFMAAIGAAPVTYTTFDPATATPVNLILSNGNLTATHVGTPVAGVQSSAVKSSGKFYFEIVLGTGVSSSDFVGILKSTGTVTGSEGPDNVLVFLGGATDLYANGTPQGINFGNRVIGDRWDVAVDLTAHLIWFRRNGGNWNTSGTANPATGVGGVSFTAGSYAPYVRFVGGVGAGEVWTANFGASAFVGAVPSGFTAGWSGGLLPITQTGSTLDFPVSSTSSVGTVSAAITVPADAQIVVVGLSAYHLTDQGHTQMTFTKGGVDTVMTRIGGGDSNVNWNTVMFWLAVPDTGAGKSLKWGWGTSPADNSQAYSVTFWKGIDTASPVRSSNGVNGSGWPRNTSTLTALSGDKIVAFAGFYKASADGSGDVTAWNNLTELTEITNQSHAEGAWATGDPTGNTTVGVQSCTGGEGGIAALVLKPGAA